MWKSKTHFAFYSWKTQLLNFPELHQLFIKSICYDDAQPRFICF